MLTTSRHLFAPSVVYSGDEASKNDFCLCLSGDSTGLVHVLLRALLALPTPIRQQDYWHMGKRQGRIRERAMRPTLTVSSSLPLPVTAREKSASTRDVGLGHEEKRFLAVWLACCLLAIALPYPATGSRPISSRSVIRAGVTSPVFTLPCPDSSSFCPSTRSTYKGSILLPGVNMQTLFVVYLFFGLRLLSPVRKPVTPATTPWPHRCWFSWPSW